MLEKTITARGWCLRAFVLMSNHYHLLFETPTANLSRGMKDLDGDYASAFNSRHGRVGHLFQGRFKSHLVDSDSYLLEVARYIVLNPVRAGMVSAVGDWPWSSYRATAGIAPVPSWLDPDPILVRFHDNDRELAASRYREFVAAGVSLSASPWENLIAQCFLGGVEFLRSVEDRIRGTSWSREHSKEQRSFRVATPDSVRAAVAAVWPGAWPPAPASDAKMAFAWLANRHTNATRAEIGRLLGITGPGASHLVQRAEIHRRSRVEFVARIEEAEELLKSRRSLFGGD